MRIWLVGPPCERDTAIESSWIGENAAEQGAGIADSRQPL